jgi:hypothetical protein
MIQSSSSYNMVSNNIPRGDKMYNLPKYKKHGVTVLTLLGCLFLWASGAQAIALGAGDVALGKTAKADVSWSTHDASKAVDGTDDFWNGGDWSRHWVEIDLGQTYLLSHVDLYYPATSGGVTFNLYGSTKDNVWSNAWNDNTAWTFLAPGSLGAYNSPVTINLMDQEIRYLKYEVSSAGDWVGLTEIAAYGTASEVPVPEPSTIFLLGAGLAALGFSRRRAKK